MLSCLSGIPSSRISLFLKGLRVVQTTCITQPNHHHHHHHTRMGGNELTLSLHEKTVLVHTCDHHQVRAATLAYRSLRKRGNTSAACVSFFASGFQRKSVRMNMAMMCALEVSAPHLPFSYSVLWSWKYKSCCCCCCCPRFHLLQEATCRRQRIAGNAVRWLELADGPP